MVGACEEISMARWPLDPNKIWGAFKEIAAVSTSQATIVLAGDTALTAAARDALSGPGSWVRDHTGGPTSAAGLVLGASEVLVVLTHPAEEDAWLGALQGVSFPSGAVVAVDEGPAATLRVTWYEKQRARASFAPSPQGWRAVWKAVVEVGGDHAVPLGRHFPVLRSLAARKVIGKTARQNGLVGAAFIIPGTDMPVMTVNQIKMVLSIAAIYGEEITTERAIELLGVVGTGFGLRAAARQVLDFVPGPGWILKGAIGYTGTKALGEAALRYFEVGAPATPGRLSGLARRLRA